MILFSMAVKKRTILIVEDEPQILQLLFDYLSAVGFYTIKAMDGKEGLKKSLKEKPDLILLDIILPKMDGLTMLKKLRQDKWGKDAKVIILTNLSDGDSVAAALKSGVYDFLVKADWKLADVVKKVKERMNI